MLGSHEWKDVQNMIRSTACFNSNNPSPLGGKLDGGPHAP